MGGKGAARCALGESEPPKGGTTNCRLKAGLRTVAVGVPRLAGRVPALDRRVTARAARGAGTRR
jgi:hypothetical protein